LPAQRIEAGLSAGRSGEAAGDGRLPLRFSPRWNAPGWRCLPLAIAAMVAAALAAVGEARAADATGEVAVAVAGPMSGRYASAGARMRAGAELAVADLNAAGGLAGARIRLVIADDRCERAGATTAADRIAAEGAVLVAGHYCASATLAAATAHARAGVLQIVPATTAPLGRPRASPTLFRLAGRDERQGEVAGRHLVAAFPGGRFALLHDRTLYAAAIADGARRALQEGGTREVLSEGFAAGQKDYTDLAYRLLAARPDAVLIAGFPTEIAVVLKAMRSAGLGAAVILGDAAAGESAPREAGALLEGARVVVRGVPEGTKVRALAARLGATADEGSLAIATYAAIEAWADAARRAGSREAGRVATALAARPVATVLGEIAFDAAGTGDVSAFTIRMWRDGKLAPMP
jgi:branched-chain amino acid transport system substrate-binding protein